MSDAALAGNSRRWATGEVSVPLSLIQANRHAGPAIILDELEKTGNSRVNGSLLDALLGLMDQRSAERWRDPYIGAPVNLAHIVWLCTANNLQDVPGALRDRLKVVRFPTPGPEHLEILAARTLQSVIIGRGLDARWAMTLADYEMRALSRYWTDGSLRGLQRLMEGVVSARDRGEMRH